MPYGIIPGEGETNWSPPSRFSKELCSRFGCVTEITDYFICTKAELTLLNYITDYGPFLMYTWNCHSPFRNKIATAQNLLRF